ncbi:hypothetical protein JG687_00013852 [Phytophthora cactorum]|uniref:CCT domain-containing protein n=1 Tax=Phytophthora cactorum TaxID=29920 RepID=A0A8T1U1F1_9STRA|nr:hypothetical protein JG687_00013852 [Phytophthora cactorum]
MSAASAVFTTRPERLPGMHGATLTPPSQRHSLLYLDENDGLSLLPESALEAVTACRDLVLDKLKERMDFVEQEGERKKTKKEDVEQVEDSLNVDEISDLFSCVEQEETSGVDFSVFIEDEDAVNVEEISQMFSGFDDSKSGSADDSVELTTSSPVDVVDTKPLEFQMEADVQKSLELCSSFDDVAACQEEEDADAENVAMLSEIFSATLEDEDAAEPVADLPPTYSLVDCKDAKNVNLVADLFTSLEESSEAGQEVEVADRSVTQDWIDALEVDNVASLFVELEQAVKTQTVAPAPVKVDSRVFVPTFSVRIEGGQRPGVRRPAVGPNSNLLVGPPGVLLAGPPAPSREERVGRWKSKRKTRSFATKQPDPSLSDTRRASAAKRQRVKGRFISDTHSFSVFFYNLFRENELFLSFPKSAAACCNVIFFPGDVQDFKTVMTTGPFADYSDYAYEAVAELLSEKFGDTCNVWVVRPSRFKHGAYSSFNNFVTTDEYGAATKYDPTAYATKHLASLMQNTQATMRRQGVNVSTALPMHLLGFSKGGIVLNQLVTELTTQAIRARDTVSVRSQAAAMD